MSKRFEGKETLKEATTEFLKKLGVAKVGHRPVVEITRTEEEIEICSTTDVQYYYQDGRVEPQIGTRFCASIPKELWRETIEALKTL